MSEVYPRPAPPHTRGPTGCFAHRVLYPLDVFPAGHFNRWAFYPLSALPTERFTHRTLYSAASSRYGPLMNHIRPLRLAAGNPSVGPWS